MKKEIKKLSINKIKVAKLNNADTKQIKGGSTFCGGAGTGGFSGAPGC